MTDTIPEADQAVEQVFDYELERIADDKVTCHVHPEQTASVVATHDGRCDTFYCAGCEAKVRKRATEEAARFLCVTCRVTHLRGIDFTIYPV